MIALPSQYAAEASAENTGAVDPMVGIGYDFYVALSSDGTMYTWGVDTKGQLGIAADASFHSDTPLCVPTDVKFKSVAVGREHVVALAQNGSVWTWGANDSGQLGHGQLHPGNKSVPTLVYFPQNTAEIVAVAASEQTSYALTADGLLFAWGSNRHGMLGIFSESENVASIIEPMQNPHLPFVSHVVAGERTAAAIASDGKVYLWGDNDCGQAGASGGTPLYTPVCKLQKKDYQALDVAIGDTHTAFLCGDGTVASFGMNGCGQFGNGEIDDRSVSLGLNKVAAVPQNLAVTSIAAGRAHMLALTRDGRLFVWGDNQKGQIGLTETAVYDTPQELIFNEEDTVRFIAARYEVSMAIDSEGHVYLFGTEEAQLPHRIVGENGTGYLYLGLPEQDFSQSVYVTANATIPAPTFTLIVPTSLDFGTLTQKSSTAEDKVATKDFTVRVSDVAYVFDGQITVTVAPAEGNGFSLTGAQSSLAYTVYNTATGGVPLSVGDTFATFSDDGSQNGRIEIDQSMISVADSYTGTLVFHVTATQQAEG